MFDSVCWTGYNTGTAARALIRMKRLRKPFFNCIDAGGADTYTFTASIASFAVNANENHFNRS